MSVLPMEKNSKNSYETMKTPKMQSNVESMKFNKFSCYQRRMQVLIFAMS